MQCFSSSAANCALERSEVTSHLMRWMNSANLLTCCFFEGHCNLMINLSKEANPRTILTVSYVESSFAVQNYV